MEDGAHAFCESEGAEGACCAAGEADAGAEEGYAEICGGHSEGVVVVWRF